jgi:hypothetical protein
MSVTLVKITPATIVYVVGFAYGPYLPDSDSVTVCATVEAARMALADELDRGADSLAEMSDDDGDNDSVSSISASAELVKSDRDGDVAASVARHGGWTTVEPDGYSYWVHASTLGTVFGDDVESDDYLDVVDALRTRGY